MDRTIHITFVPLDPATRLVKISVTLPKTSSVGTLLERLAETVNVPKEDMCIADIHENEVYEVLHPKESLNIRDSDIYVYQLEPISSIHRLQACKQEGNDAAVKFSNQTNGVESFYSCVSRSSSPEVEEKEVEFSLPEEMTLPAETRQLYDSEDEWAHILCNHTSELSFHRLYNTKRSTHQERE